MTLRYGSVCSGIEAATMAWHPLGWTPAFFAEIEKFPSAVLAHHYGSNMPNEPLSTNGVPNHGDMNKFREWPDHAIDILVGGTPCQSFSIAGFRKGLADPRGNLMLVYLAMLDRYRPEWMVWENVPGVLSSGQGRDFGAFLGGLAELGYGFAYRVLDAQYVRVDGFGRAVPQRRRRVFVVGNSRTWRRAAAALFERESMSWDTAPRREAGKIAAPTISARPTGGGGLGTDFDLDGGLIASTGDVSHCLNAGGMGRQDAETETMVAFPLTAGMAASAARMPQEQGALLPVVFNPKAGGNPTIGQCVNHDGTAYTLDNDCYSSAIMIDWRVRRLTPKECERLQGFPDHFTDVPWRGKRGAPDGPRYKALGNSMAVNVMRWIGRRIERVEQITLKKNGSE